MVDSPRETSWLAVLCLVVGVLGLALGLAGVAALYWGPWRDPQGGDMLGLLVALFAGAVVVAGLATASGIAALLRIQQNPEREAGIPFAIAGIALGILPLAWIVWAMYF